MKSLFQEQLQAAYQQGFQQGFKEVFQQIIEQCIERGRREQQQLILENFLQIRFGKLDPKIAAFLAPASTLPVAEFTIMQLSISMLSVDEIGRQQALRLLAENVLKARSNEWGDILPTVITNLLELPEEQLRVLLLQLPQLSIDELIALIVDS